MKCIFAVAVRDKILRDPAQESGLVWRNMVSSLRICWLRSEKSAVGRRSSEPRIYHTYCVTAYPEEFFGRVETESGALSIRSGGRCGGLLQASQLSPVCLHCTTVDMRCSIATCAGRMVLNAMQKNMYLG